jgi:DNA-binding MarR family transcriptional regulator
MKSKPPKFDISDTNNCPYYLITRASLSIRAELRKAFAKAGIGHIKPAYLGVLMCLWREDSLDETLGKFGSHAGMKTADLGRCAGLEPSTMTGVIDRMERDGLVRREDDPGDRRAQRIILTDEGFRVREQLIAAVDSSLDAVFAGVETGGIEELKHVLRRVLTNTERGAVE